MWATTTLKTLGAEARNRTQYSGFGDHSLTICIFFDICSLKESNLRNLSTKQEDYHYPKRALEKAGIEPTPSTCKAPTLPLCNIPMWWTYFNGLICDPPVQRLYGSPARELKKVGLEPTQTLRIREPLYH